MGQELDAADLLAVSPSFTLKPSDPESDSRKTLARQLALYGHLGMMFPVAIGLGLLCGYQLDRWLGTTPWLALLGFGFGAAAAIRNVLRSVAVSEINDLEASDASQTPISSQEKVDRRNSQGAE